MNPADEMAAKIEPTERQSAGAVAGSHDDFEEQLHATLKDLQRTNHQSKPAEDLHGSDDKDLDEQLRVSVEALLHPSPPPAPVEELDDLLLAIRHHLDDEASERKAIHNRLRAIENEMERLASRGFRYLLAIFIAVAVTVAWQSYGEPIKQIIATKAPELGWSPGTKQMIASWMQQLGLTKPLAVESKAAPVTQTAPENVAPKAPAPSLDPEQVQQIEANIAVVRQAVERQLAEVRETVERQLAAGQDQMAREIEKLQAADTEILAKLPAPPPQRPAAPARKPKPVPPSSRAPGAPPTSLAPRPPPHP
jgi:hypothetical protein